MGLYCKGSAQCHCWCNPGDEHMPRCRHMYSNFTPRSCHEEDEVAVQHFSLPWGGRDMKVMQYPTQYQLDSVKNKRWSDAGGAEQAVIVVARDGGNLFAEQ